MGITRDIQWSRADLSLKIMQAEESGIIYPKY